MDEKKKTSKKWFRFSLILGLTVLVIVGFLWETNRNLDELLEYHVNTLVNRDGTLDITYSYQWKVLNDSREGPLEWVSLGVPNNNYELVSYDGAITGLHDFGRRDGLIAFDLDRAYKKDEVAAFSFTIHQKDMLCEDKEEPSLLLYDFIPGWFDEMKVAHYLFTWQDNGMILIENADRKRGNILIWEGSLDEGEKCQMLVGFRRTAFENPEVVTWQPHQETKGKDYGEQAAVAILILGLGLLIAFKAAFWEDNYQNGRGYRYHRSYYHSSGGHSNCACACAGCACACACAGGGRAGCSKKDFYHKDFNHKI